MKVTSSNGFTLLEVMISLAILAVALTVLLQAHVLNLKLTAHTEFRTRAMLLAEKKIAELESREKISSWRRTGFFEGTDKDFSWEEEISPFTFGGFELSGLYTGGVTVRWKEGRDKKNVKLITYLFR